jgi:hypothetical protein
VSPISLVYMKAANKLANGSDRYVEIQPGYMSFHFELQSALIKFIKYAPSRKPELLTSDDQLCSDVSKGNRGAKVMTHEEHAKCVGAIITNLQSLETVIRIFLAAVNKQSWGMPKAGELEVDENYLTNFRAFGPLIDRYNDALTAEERAKYAVDPEHPGLRHRRFIAWDRLMRPFQRARPLDHMYLG